MFLQICSPCTFQNSLWFLFFPQHIRNYNHALPAQNIRKCKVFWQFRTHCKCTFTSKISDQLKSRSQNWNTDIWGWFSLTSCPKLVEHIVNIKNVFVEHLGKNWFVECIISLSGNITLLTTFTFLNISRNFLA